ncbi:hypothetical protein DFH06DRAFT_1243120 [Mycena polygramma]|nr:hypothetical protein DFH06DRAFT_1243120 [Mycena polygramma]
MSSPTPPTTPHNELLELTQQLTPSKTPRTTRQLCLDVQLHANNASDAYGSLKRQLADLTNQVGNAPPRRKRRLRHSRATAATDDVENPVTLEERVRSAGRHYAIEYGLFLHTDVVELFATSVDPDFDEAKEFDSEDSQVQGQLRDILSTLPNDAKDPQIRKHEWIAKSFYDGLSGQLGNFNTRLRQDSIVHIAANTKFKDFSQDPPADVSVNVDDFDSSSSRFNAFARYIGYQEATPGTDAFYSPLKAQVLYKDYDGTMNVYKIFRGPALLSIYVSNMIERTRHIVRAIFGAIVNSSVMGMWVYSADTELVAEGDETQINYRFLWLTFARQISEGLREDADWVKDLFNYWNKIIFPHTDNSPAEAMSTNRRAVLEEVDAMDAAFRAANAPRITSPRATSPDPDRRTTPSPRRVPTARRPGPSDAETSQRGSQSTAGRENSPANAASTRRAYSRRSARR